MPKEPVPVPGMNVTADVGPHTAGSNFEVNRKSETEPVYDQTGISSGTRREAGRLPVAGDEISPGNQSDPDMAIHDRAEKFSAAKDQRLDKRGDAGETMRT